MTHHDHHHHELPANPLADLRLRRPPFWMISAFLIFVVVSWIPLVVGARRRVATSEDPRIQLPQDMGTQPRFKAQHVNPLFADDRADRPQVAGTVSREGLQNDDFYFRGWTRQDNKVTFFKGFPPQVKVNLALLQRGQNRFNIYCSACHGYDGFGHGMVNDHAVEKHEPGWVQAANLHDAPIKQRPEGHIFNTISNGIRNMPAHGGQIPVPDRWAIVAYVRALQLSQDAPANLVPPEKLANVK